MALSYKTRKRLALLILVFGVPTYIVATITVINLLDRPPLWVEFFVYLALGIVWALPFKSIFRGIGQADPDAPEDPNQDR